MNAKRTVLCLPVIWVILALVAGGAHGAVFTTNTAIGPSNTTYDGEDIVVTNCTVTVDGAHAFASLQVAAGGVLTHSAFPNGLAPLIFDVTNEVQILSSTNPAILLNTNVSLPVEVTDTGDTVDYTNGVDYLTVPLTNGFTELLWTNTSSIPDGATVLVSYSWTENLTAGLILTVAGNVNVAPGGRIDASGNGYASNLGTGHGFNTFPPFGDGSGAGYGGIGGFSASNAVGGVCYGSVAQPIALGSGGGSSYAGAGGSGGGVVQIFAGGNINVDGMLLANGVNATNSRAGGGSGGSIWLSATNLSGTGSIAANGGTGEPVRGGGGGGGRISLQCGTNNFAGAITAYGGTGWETGGAGTLFTQVAGQTNLLLVDNGGQAGTNSTVALPALSAVSIRGNAGVIPLGSWSALNVTIASNSALVALSPPTIMNVNVNGTLNVQAGGRIIGDGLGFPAGSGGGAGRPYYDGINDPCSGGGYGGSGAVPFPPYVLGGAAYGVPTGGGTFGSGGGNQSPYSIGGPGGGALQIYVTGPLQLDGQISVNGGNGAGTGGGGGSGGSIYISATSIAGNGSFSANGGNGAGTAGGGGGGGRIAIYSTTYGFNGTLNAAGGGGANWGGAGTIYQQQSSPSAYQLIVDNAGHAGTNTPLQSVNSANLILRNGAVATVISQAAFAGLTISSNAWVTPGSLENLGTVNLFISGNATIQPGSGITATYPNTSSTSGAFYSSFPYPCGGGGHGGAGGNSTGNLALGGGAMESVPTLPTGDGGSGGSFQSYSIGGLGGGVVDLTVSGTLQLNGIISVNGGNGSGDGGGGGAGGSIYLNSSTFTGTGSLTANGGNGVDATGGGGGGGCIAAVFNTKSFSGALTAYGGGGANYGGAGTIYLKTNSVSHGTLIVDNGGNVGANSLPVSSSTVDLTLQNGGILYASTSLSVGNLVINSNAWLIATNLVNQNPSTTLHLTVNGNAIIQAGGGISGDLTGYHSGLGTGAGGVYAISPYYSGGGGGHGGYGASGFTNYMSTGGNSGFDNYNSPNYAGAGGGGSSPYSVGGNGGGLIQMSVTGTLQVNGSLSANGGNGSGTGGGGGAGGGLALNITGGLTGNGTIAANGGGGLSNIGGGGGGGIIAAICGSNVFAGTISATGGAGAGYGGAGLIYLQTNGVTGVSSALIVDNAGHHGTNTPLPNVSSASGVILRNGALVSPSYGQTIGSLLITSNAWLLGSTVNAGNYPGDVYLTVNGGATIQPGSGILTDAGNSTQQGGRGFSSTLSPWYQCTGAGHGGYGALSLSNSQPGGLTYDSSAEPTTSGSSGGGYTPYSIGGAGGGFVNLRVNGAMQLNGTISANGGNGTGSGGGGGSGGGIYLNLGSLAGTGGITANGGNGAPTYGGGGGGGRVAVYFNSNSFAGTVSAYGGGGANFGGAGTIYYKTNNQPYGLLVLDNGGNAGTNTTFDLTTVNATIQNKAVGFLTSVGAWDPYNLLVRTNGVLAAAATSGAHLINAHAITIDPGGLISMDGSGYGPQTGPGAGSITQITHGGGSHGGYGGGYTSDNNAYDSIQTPISAGSGGATYLSGNYSSYGGFGGGALQLVAPTLIVNGRLSANGLNGGPGSGGGAGGSLYIQNVVNLMGSGVISANGGSSTGSAGGGGGGRISLYCNSNSFTGQFSASGGSALYPGGAGTICTHIDGLATLTVDNGGLNGTNTPYSSSYSPPAAPFNLNISGGAVLTPLTPLPLLGSLNINAGSTLTVPGAETTLGLAVLNNFNLTGSVALDNQGYPQTYGPGAGVTSANQGSGGGYGGTGGNSANGMSGGTNYGSAAQPVDFGSGGGAGVNTITGGSSGGGAGRISVGGTLTINGNLSANGNYGWQDNSGGGAGGSLWITANTLAGAGNISADGGGGNLEDGGGGGGGRIAIYAPANEFDGTTNVPGGNGAYPGQAGTVFFSSTLNNFVVSSQTPSGIVSNTVSSVTLTFSDAIAPASVLASDFSVTTPSGPVPAGSISVAATGVYTEQVSFPTQNLVGNYTIQATPPLASILSQQLAAVYTGSFSITLPTISGTVTDTNNAPVGGVLLQPTGGLTGATTDTNGNYSFGVPVGWSGSVTPSLGTVAFVPSSQTYTDVTNSVAGQDYLMVPTVSPSLTTSVSGTNLTLNWSGIPGVTYQALWSTNLMNWQTYGSALPGTNGPMQFNILLDTEPSVFFRLSATY